MLQDAFFDNLVKSQNTPFHETEEAFPPPTFEANSNGSTTPTPGWGLTSFGLLMDFLEHLFFYCEKTTQNC
jgi:hypothetical protein